MDFSRLISPSLVIETSIGKLHELRHQKTIFDFIGNDRGDVLVKELDTDIKTRNFYRCLSHQYPYVKAATIGKQETKKLVL